MRYDIVLFDADDTLLDFGMAEKAALRRAFGHFSLPFDDEIEKGYMEINHGLWQALERGEVTKPQILATRFQKTFERFRLDGPRDGSFEQLYQRLLGEGAYMVPGAMEVLLRVKETCRVAIVTNGEKRTQENRMRLSGLDKLVEGVFISEEIGAVKPDPAYFDAVFGRLGDPDRSRALIVGDSLTGDMKGGVNAGIDSCWFNPKGKPNASGIPVTYEIRDLHELIGILA